MIDNTSSKLLRISGSILILGILFFGRSTSVLSRGEERTGGSNTRSTPERESSQENEPATARWGSVDGSQPTTHEQWKNQQPPAAPLHVERIYVSKTLSTEDAPEEVVCALVNPAIYAGISASLAQWAADVESEGWSVVIYNGTFPDPPALRNHLAAIDNLDGCLLIGDFPVPWAEIVSNLPVTDYPSDVFYMDLDGVWTDDNFNGVYDGHSGDTIPEIWIGRLLAGNLDFGDGEISLVNNYFAKNHAYRTGNLSLPSRALLYLDDDWEYAADNMQQNIAQLYSDITVVSDPQTTRALDYGQRLVDYYAWVQLIAHSYPSRHNFTYQEGEGPEAIYNEDIYRIDPHAFFFNLSACKAGRFVERNYLAGWYTFADTYGLLTISTTKPGLMKRGNDFFYGLVAQEMPLGEAFRGWFEVYGVTDQPAHYGLTLLGDPTLIVVTDEQLAEAPDSIAINGPIAGSVGITYNFSATVDPTTTTQPLMYTWEATGQVSVKHKSGLSDTVAFTWRDTPGTKAVTVTVTNFAGSVTGTHTITINTPEIETTPVSFHETLTLGSVVTRSLNIANIGQGNLAFELTEIDHVSSSASDRDSFGYTYKDSNQPDGPGYQWIEIAPPAGGSGARVDLPADWQGGYSWPISLPFIFDYYANDYAQLAINSYGALNFTDRSIGSGNLPLPSSRIFAVETFVAPFWDFLVLDPGAVYFQALDSMFIVEYYQVSRYGGSGHGTWQVILFENGNILFQYQDVDFAYYWGNNGRSATVGIQGDAITGLQYSYDSPILSDGLAICFAYPGQMADCSIYEETPWLSHTPGAGIVPVDGTQTVDLVFDARVPEVTQPGDYQTWLVMLTNNPDERLIEIPVTLTVIPSYKIFFPHVEK